MPKPTKRQKEMLQVLIEELKYMKYADDINSIAIMKDIDTSIHAMMQGDKDPKIAPRHADHLSDILYEIVTLIRDVERN